MEIILILMIIYYKFKDSKRLKDGVIPNIFDFPEHLRPNVSKKRAPPKKRTINDLGEPSYSKTGTEMKVKIRKLGSSPSMEDFL